MADPMLNYRLEGSGPPLLLVHGFGISFPIWGSLAPLLRRDFTVVMIELPGVGASLAPPEGQDYQETAIAGIEAVRRALGIERWNVLGYSTGSRIAEAYVQAYPASVCRAIFLCPLLVDAHKMSSLRFAVRLDERWPGFGQWILSGWRLRFLISLLGFNLQPDPRSAEWYAEITATPVRVLKETIRATANVAGSPFSVPVPHVMIWGDRDLVPATPRNAGEHDQFVHGRHAAPEESADEVARIIVSLEREDQTTGEPRARAG